MFEFGEFSKITDGEIDLILDKKVPEDVEKGYVPAYFFNIVLHDKSQIIGYIDLRIGNNLNTYYGGNVGYAISPDFRGNHYALKACKLLFEVVRYHKMERVYITCNPENIASRKTIEKLGLAFVEIADLPEDNPMYLDGEKQKCVYRWESL